MEKVLTAGITVYNIKETYLRICLDSVLQNKGDGLEIMIIDDGSDEACAAVCRAYQKKDSRVRYIRNEKNLGVGASRNRIIRNAKGRWIAFVDGDDAVSDRLFASVCASDMQYDVVRFKHAAFQNEISDPKEEAAPVFLDENTVREIGISAAVRHQENIGILRDANVSISLVTTAVYRRAFLTENGCFFKENLRAAEDSLFNARVCVLKPRYAYLAETLYFYRTNPDSVTRRYNENIKKTTDAYLAEIGRFIAENYPNDARVAQKYYCYRCNLATINNFEQHIFHRGNKGTLGKRKRAFSALVSEKPYSEALKYAENMEVHKYRLILKAARKKRFYAIDFAYRFPAVFKLYGGMQRRVKKREKI